MKLRKNASSEFSPLLRFDTEIRRIVCTAHAIESVNARMHRAARDRGRFPNEQAALKCAYPAIVSLGLTGTGQDRWAMRGKTAMSRPSTSPSRATCR